MSIPVVALLRMQARCRDVTGGSPLYRRLACMNGWPPVRALAFVAVVATACTPLAGDRATGPLPTETSTVAVRLQVGQANAVRAARLTAFYRRTQAGAAIVLADTTLSLTPGQVAVPFAVELGPCLADPALGDASSGTTPSCPLQVAIALRDGAGVLLDSASIGPLAARPGVPLTAPTVSFAVASEIALSLPDTLRAGDTVTVTAVVRDSSGTTLAGRSVTWQSGDPTVATIDGTGRLVAIRPGAVTISARSANAVGVVSRTVFGDVASVTVTLPELIRYNDVLSASVVARDRNGAVVSGEVVTWLSSDTSVARVDSTGRLLIASAGDVTISAVVAGRRADVARSIRPEGISGLFANYSYVCGLGTSGRTYCWGSGAQGGHVATNRPIPTEVPSDSTFVELAGGAFHLCGRTASGVVMCLGETNPWGQLAVGDVTPRARMALTVGGPGQYVGLAAGGQQTCALAADGTSWCAGLGNRMGNGTTAATPVTSFVQTLLPAGTALTSLSGPGVVTCGRASNGTHWCWGNPILPLVSPVGTPAGPGLPGQMNFGAITVQLMRPGNSTACVLDAANDAWCWGQNQFGQVGVGDDSARASPTRVLAPPGVTFADIQPYSAHTCALSTSARVYCWGNNGSGAVGDGTRTNRFAPVEVALPPNVVPTRLVSSANGACIETADGQPWCWGLHTGSGTLDAQDVPVPVRLPGTPPP